MVLIYQLERRERTNIFVQFIVTFHYPGVTARLLRKASSSVVPFITRLFSISPNLGKTPSKWKNANQFHRYSRKAKRNLCALIGQLFSPVLWIKFWKNFRQFKKFAKRSSVWLSSCFILHITVNTFLSLVGLTF